MQYFLAVILGLATVFMPTMLIFGSSILHSKYVLAGKIENKRGISPDKKLINKFKKNFTFSLQSDPRTFYKTAIKNKFLLYILLFTSFLGATLAVFTTWYLLIPAIVLTIFAHIYGYASPIKLLKERDLLLKRALDISSKQLGYTAEEVQQPDQVVKVTEWKDLLTPTAFEFHVPTNFNADGQESFLRQFNQVFGTSSSWVADLEKGGWDYNKGKLNIKQVPPLPTRASWHERYILDPSVAWSFFPIAIGIENGIPITNEETGEVERVLGFDVNGEQMELSKKLGINIGPEIVASPMVLVGGGVGGGKAMDINTLVPVLTD